MTHKIIYNVKDRKTEVSYFEGKVYEVTGECKRCGECCKIYAPYPEWKDKDGKCNKLYYDTINGEYVAICKVHRNKPIGCAIYPSDTLDKIPDKCGFRLRLKQ